jgi:Ca-activated chloride channel family protein
VTFEKPEFFSLLFALIPLIVLMIINYKLRFLRLCRLIKALSPASTVKFRLRYFFSSLFFIIFFVCTVLALADPHSGSRIVRELRLGTDVILAFDLSRSMNVRDAAPLAANLSASRLERAVKTAAVLLENFHTPDDASRNVRFGAVIGKGSAVLAVPLTDDSEALWGLFDNLNSDAMTSRGTDLEKLLDTAADSFVSNFPTGRVVVLFSDGETLSGALNSAVDYLREKDITVFTVGEGSAYGARVPDTTVTSLPRRDVMETIAARTGGAYIDGNAEDAAILLAQRLRSPAILSGLESPWVFREEKAAQWFMFIILAFLSLALSKFCVTRFISSRQ